MDVSKKYTTLFNLFFSAKEWSSDSARQGLKILLILRTFVSLTSAFGLFISQYLVPLDVPMTLIYWLLGAILISVLLGTWRLQKAWPVTNEELFCHVLVDVIFLIILLANTGGAGNPLISYLLVLLSVTATLLPKMYVKIFAVGAIFIYTFFLFGDLQVERSMEMDSDQETFFELHLLGMWVIFLVSALLISVLITRMVDAIQNREINLAKAREKEIRNEQLVAIGTLAAGTAHALGTPLSTMAVLLTDLDKLDKAELSSTEVMQDISLLKQQVSRCKHSLSQLTQYYNKGNPAQEEKISLGVFKDTIQDYIVNIYPSAPVSFSTIGDTNSRIISNLSIKHAVINIIENSIKAAKTRVEITLQIANKQPVHFEISITDDGPGIPPKVMASMGKPFVSISKESMGLGIFLANASIQRLGGEIKMLNLKDRGALTLIKLPLQDHLQA